MPSWKEVLEETRALGGAIDVVRRRYMRELAEHTGRNVIAYYSGWLQKSDFFQGRSGLEINDSDKNGFMATVHGLDRDKGLDLLLHTPGGSVAATESIIDYLRQMFGTNIRAIVPQLAMSGGTMIACACKSILMGKHSNLGPIDPQIAGLPAHALLEAWQQATADIARNSALAAAWAPVLGKFHPGLLGECERAIQWSKTVAQESLEKAMFADEGDADAKSRTIENIVKLLSSHDDTLSHARHLHRDVLKDAGLKIEELESDQRLQDLVLTVHHASIQTLATTAVYKIIQNQNEVAQLSVMQMPG